MTPQEKLVLKRIALTVGILAVVTTIVVLIVQNNKFKREAEEKELGGDNGLSKPSGSSGGSSGGSSAATLNGRTFSTTEIEKMQSYMLLLGQMAQNQYLIGQIRDTGGIDGKIGTGFKNALAECIRIGAVKSLDELYETATRTM